MTEQKAIEEFNLLKKTLMFVPRKDTIDIAIKALGKQIPKKMTDDGYHHITCDCDHRIDMYMRFEISYCPYCGQAIKWE